jgi:hypothetical protein
MFFLSSLEIPGNSVIGKESFLFFVFENMAYGALVFAH